MIAARIAGWQSFFWGEWEERNGTFFGEIEDFS